jgi:pimeloyl-ACP methyl ester carboxylesterase
MSTEIDQEIALEHHTVATNGIALHVVQAGPRDGPLVVLLHGFPEFWYGWRAQIVGLARRGFRVWAPDQRGYALSDKPRGIGAYRIDALADDIVGLLDAAGRERACVAGHDWGAGVAWWLGLKHPDRLKKLGILNVPHPTVLLRHLLSSPAQARKSWYMFFFQIPGLPERIIRANDWSFGVRSLVGSSLPGTFSPDDLNRYRAAWSHQGAMTGMVNWYRAAFQRRPTLPKDTRVHVPTLVIWGAKDRFLDAAMAQPSADLCDAGRLVMVLDATHWVQHEAAERVTALLAEHFAEG